MGNGRFLLEIYKLFTESSFQSGILRSFLLAARRPTMVAELAKFCCKQCAHRAGACRIESLDGQSLVRDVFRATDVRIEWELVDSRVHII